MDVTEVHIGIFHRERVFALYGVYESGLERSHFGKGCHRKCTNRIGRRYVRKGFTLRQMLLNDFTESHILGCDIAVFS